MAMDMDGTPGVDKMHHGTPPRGKDGTANAQLQQIRKWIHEGKSDPLRAVQNMNKIGAAIDHLAEVAGWPYSSRAGAFQILRVPNTTVVTPAGAIVPGNARWPSAGTVLAVYGTVVGADPLDTAMASVSVSVAYRGGDKNLIINGQAADFVLYSAVFTQSSPWFPLSIVVTGEDTTWQIRFRNEATAGPDLLPALYFAFVPTPDPDGSQGKW